jgi:hypothetical protein
MSEEGRKAANPTLTDGEGFGKGDEANVTDVRRAAIRLIALAYTTSVLHPNLRIVRAAANLHHLWKCDLQGHFFISPLQLGVNAGCAT